MSTEKTQKFINVSYIDTILKKLYDWMPFKKKDGGILQDSRDENGIITTQITNPGEIALGTYNQSNIDTILSVGVGNKDNRLNSLEIRKDGLIYIISDVKTNSIESLQSLLEKKGTIKCSDYSEALQYVSMNYLGTMIYIENDSEYDNENRVAGLYTICRSYNGSIILSRLGTTSSVSKEVEERVVDLEIRVGDLEDWTDEGSITIEELKSIIQNQ